MTDGAITPEVYAQLQQGGTFPIFPYLDPSGQPVIANLATPATASVAAAPSTAQAQASLAATSSFFGNIAAPFVSAATTIVGAAQSVATAIQAGFATITGQRVVNPNPVSAPSTGPSPGTTTTPNPWASLQQQFAASSYKPTPVTVGVFNPSYVPAVPPVAPPASLPPPPAQTQRPALTPVMPSVPFIPVSAPPPLATPTTPPPPTLPTPPAPKPTTTTTPTMPATNPTMTLAIPAPSPSGPSLYPGPTGQLIPTYPGTIPMPTTAAKGLFSFMPYSNWLLALIALMLGYSFWPREVASK